MVLECVVNVSEGRDLDAIAALTATAGRDLLDLHTDPHHHRSVLTLLGEDAVCRVAREAIVRLDLSTHRGAHPRLGVVDVVPFVPLDGSTMADALAARDAFARWMADEHSVPCFLYGPERSLVELRRDAFRELQPDRGPSVPHPTAGAACVGARPVLVAFNVWLAGPAVDEARAVAAMIRRPELRALGLEVGDGVQVSMNLVEPELLGPAAAFDLVAQQIGGRERIERAELVGLVPEAVLRAIDPDRWPELGLSRDRTIEARVGALGS